MATESSEVVAIVCFGDSSPKSYSKDSISAPATVALPDRVTERGMGPVTGVDVRLLQAITGGIALILAWQSDGLVVPLLVLIATVAV